MNYQLRVQRLSFSASVRRMPVGRSRPKCAAVLAAAIVLLFHGASATASTISLAARIDLPNNRFVVPIDITDGSNVTAWQLDVTYDATDVEVATACDPFADAYCSFWTGPVSEGNFFSSGAPYNLLNPGFVGLDVFTSAQTGLLFGVSGAFAGVSPFPSGDGTLAFVLFDLMGPGSSVISISNPSVTSTAVPEPGTLIYLTIGLFLMRRATRRLNRTTLR
jgi:hypothetical protein